MRRSSPVGAPKTKLGKPARVSPEAGDMFRIELSDGSELKGLVVKDDAVLGPFRNVLLVYVFGRDRVELPTKISKSSQRQLLVPPFLTNSSPWKKGLFRTTGRMLNGAINTDLRHVFRHRLTRRFLDEYGQSAKPSTLVIGDWALKFDAAVRKDIDEALSLGFVVKETDV